MNRVALLAYNYIALNGYAGAMINSRSVAQGTKTELRNGSLRQLLKNEHDVNPGALN